MTETQIAFIKLQIAAGTNTGDGDDWYLWVINGGKQSFILTEICILKMYNYKVKKIEALKKAIFGSFLKLIFKKKDFYKGCNTHILSDANYTHKHTHSWTVCT